MLLRQHPVGFLVDLSLRASHNTGVPQRLSNEEGSTPAEVGNRLGRKRPAKVAPTAQPETILGWYRRLVAQKFDGPKYLAHQRLVTLLEFGHLGEVIHRGRHPVGAVQ